MAELLLVFILCVLWGIYAGTMQKKENDSSKMMCIIVGVVNALLAPFAMGFAIYRNMKELE